MPSGRPEPCFAYSERCTVEEFEAHVEATEVNADGRRGGLDYALLKLSAEAGEAGQIRAREILAGKGDDPGGALLGPVATLKRRAMYALELGDVAWYLVEVARLLGLTLEQVLALNVMKLRRRRSCKAAGMPNEGKDPVGELAEAMKFLTPKTEVPAPTPDEFQPCTLCGDQTRHVGHSALRPEFHEKPICKAPDCRARAR